MWLCANCKEWCSEYRVVPEEDPEPFGTVRVWFCAKEECRKELKEKYKDLDIPIEGEQGGRD